MIALLVLALAHTADVALTLVGLELVGGVREVGILAGPVYRAAGPSGLLALLVVGLAIQYALLATLAVAVRRGLPPWTYRLGLAIALGLATYPVIVNAVLVLG